MKFNDFKVLVLNEASDNDAAYYEDITFAQMIEIYKKHCTGNQVDIYRGTKSSHRTYNIIEGQKGGRRSQNTSNHYTRIFDQLISEKNKAYPLRSASIIASTDRNYAKRYGTVYNVIPYDDTWIGIVPSEDIWDLRVNMSVGSKSLVSMNETFSKAGISSGDIDDIAEEIESMSEDDFKKYFGGNFKSQENVGQQIREMYDLDKLGLKFVQSKDYKGSQGEVWIGGKCLLIEAEQYEKLDGILNKLDADHVILFKKDEHYNIDKYAYEYVEYADDDYEPELINLKEKKIVEISGYLVDKVSAEDFFKLFAKYVKPSEKADFEELRDSKLEDIDETDEIIEYLKYADFDEFVEYLDIDGFKIHNNKYHKDYEYFIFY